MASDLAGTGNGNYFGGRGDSVPGARPVAGPVTDDYKAPFRLPEHAVRAAFEVESRPVLDSSRFFADLRGGTVRLAGDEPLTKWDHVAQAGMIMAIMRRHLTPDQQALMIVRWAYSTLPDTMRLKKKCLWRALNLIRPELSHAPLPYVVDVLRGWARMPRKQDLWWADKLDVEVRQLRRWRNGWRRQNDRTWGILSLLNTLEQEIYSQLLDPLTEAGLVGE